MQVQRYRQRVSGPLLDRIDIHVEVPAVPFKELTGTTAGETSAEICQRVLAAQAIQRERFAAKTTRCNARMTSRQLRPFCALDEDCRELLRAAIQYRTLDRFVKFVERVARD